MEGQVIKICEKEESLERPIDLKTSCRLCGNFSLTIVKLFTDQGLCSELSNKINLYLPVEVQPGDGLPEQCCWNCTCSVMSWHKLYVTCYTTHQKLLEFKKSQENTMNELNNFVEQQNEEEAQIEDPMEPEESYEELQEEALVAKSEEESHHVFVESVEELEEEKRVSCHICNQSFKNERACIYHVNKEHQSKSSKVKIPCPICGLEREKNRMYIHIARLHTEDRPFACETCGKTFKMKADLRSHQISHSNLKPFKCKFCPRAFNLQKSLEYHWIAHMKKKPFSCKLCGAELCRKCTWQEHIRRVHKMTEQQYHDFPPEKLKELTVNSNEDTVKARTCTECSITFKYKKSLRGHMKKVHPIPTLYSEKYPFLCDICGKGFKFRNYLRKHVTNHAEKKPYKCPHCSKAFNLNSVLKKHLNVHKERKSMVCEACGKVFLQEAKFMMHDCTTSKLLMNKV